MNTVDSKKFIPAWSHVHAQNLHYRDTVLCTGTAESCNGMRVERGVKYIVFELYSSTYRYWHLRVPASPRHASPPRGWDSLTFVPLVVLGAGGATKDALYIATDVGALH